MKIQCVFCDIQWVDDGSGICPNCGYVNSEQKPKRFIAKMYLVRGKKEMIHKERVVAHTIEEACKMFRAKARYLGYRIVDMEVYEDEE